MSLAWRSVRIVVLVATWIGIPVHASGQPLRLFVFGAVPGGSLGKAMLDVPIPGAAARVAAVPLNRGPLVATVARRATQLPL